MAINLLGLARATEDLDFYIEPDRENVERLKHWGDAEAIKWRFNLEEG